MRVNCPTSTGPVLELKDVCVSFNIRRNRTVQAVSGVSFGINQQETLGLVGESGCGKSTLARAIVQLPPPTSGHVLLAGCDLAAMDSCSLRAMRSRIQMVFQDPVSSLNPTRRIGRSIGEPLRVCSGLDKVEIVSQVRKMMVAVGLEPGQYEDQVPGKLSGGQCQRASIARALMTRPDVLICDEPVSALDVSVQAQILNLLNTIKKDFRLAMLFISHDLAVVKRVSDRVAVMYQGAICELAPVERLYSCPAHPYTAAMLKDIPQPRTGDRRTTGIMAANNLPSPYSLLSGCRFHSRCPRMKTLCTEQSPPMSVIAIGHQVACHFPLLENLST